MFRFYKTILNLKTRLQEQNLRKHIIFFHYHLNLFICCKTKLKIKFMFCRMSLVYRMNFSTAVANAPVTVTADMNIKVPLK